MSGHRLKLDRLQGAGYALGGDGSLDGPRTPAQGDDPQVAELPVDGRKGVRDLSAFDGDGPGLPQRVLPREGEGRVRAVQGEGVVDALPLVQGGRSPEPQPRALRPAEGADADFKGGGRSERDGGPVAGDGESLDEEPPPFDRLRHLEVDLVPPRLVVVGKGRLGDGDRRRQSDGGRDCQEALRGLALPGLPAPVPVAVSVDVVLVRPPGLAEPAVRAEGHPPARPLPAPALAAKAAQGLARPPRHQPQRAGAALHRLRRRGRLAPHQLGRRPCVEPRPKPVLQQVGGHQGQPPTAYLPDDGDQPRQAQEDGNRHPHLGRPDGGVAVCAVGQGAHRHHRHDLRECEPQQDLVLGLHVGWNLVFSHGSSPSSRRPSRRCC